MHCGKMYVIKLLLSSYKFFEFTFCEQLFMSRFYWCISISNCNLILLDFIDYCKILLMRVMLQTRKPTWWDLPVKITRIILRTSEAVLPLGRHSKLGNLFRKGLHKHRPCHFCLYSNVHEQWSIHHKRQVAVSKSRSWKSPFPAFPHISLLIIDH